jgi:hypothetical protein
MSNSLSIHLKIPQSSYETFQYRWLLTDYQLYLKLYEIWGSCGSDDLDIGLLRCDAMWTCT